MWGIRTEKEGGGLAAVHGVLSWSTPHSLRWYLAGSKRGLTATQVSFGGTVGSRGCHRL